MVLYCIEHAYGIIKAIVHKFKYHPQDDAFFFVNVEVSSMNCPAVDKIKYFQMPDPYEIARYSTHSQNEIKQYTNKTISDFFKEIDSDPLDFSHIYVLSEAYNPFILYFEINSIRYMAVETADNAFSDYASGRAISHLMSLHPEAYVYNCLIRDMHLQDAHGENCTRAYLYSDRSAFNAVSDKAAAEIFRFGEALTSLDDKFKRQLIEGYSIEQCSFDTVLLLSSPFYTNGSFAIHKSEMPSKYINEYKFDAASYFYKTIIDYYFNDVDIVLKLHPESDDNFVQSFSGFKQLPKDFPMEVFLLLDKKFDLVCPDFGSDVEIFKSNNFNVTVFGGLIFDFFKYIHFVFLTFTLINAIGIPEKITVSGIDMSQLCHFKDRAYKDFKDVVFEQLHWHNVWDANFIIADPFGDFEEIINNAPEDCLIFVYGTCTEDSGVFASQEMICSLTCMSEAEEELQRFSWTVLSKNKELLDAVREFSVSYTLEKANVTIQSSPCN